MNKFEFKTTATECRNYMTHILTGQVKIIFHGVTSNRATSNGVTSNGVTSNGITSTE